MATYVVGAFVAVALFFAVRHVYRNFWAGRTAAAAAARPVTNRLPAAIHRNN